MACTHLAVTHTLEQLEAKLSGRPEKVEEIFTERSENVSLRL